MTEIQEKLKQLEEKWGRKIRKPFGKTIKKLSDEAAQQISQRNFNLKQRFLVPDVEVGFQLLGEEALEGRTLDWVDLGGLESASNFYFQYVENVLNKGCRLSGTTMSENAISKLAAKVIKEEPVASDPQQRSPSKIKAEMRRAFSWVQNPKCSFYEIDPPVVAKLKKNDHQASLKESQLFVPSSFSVFVDKIKDVAVLKKGFEVLEAFRSKLQPGSAMTIVYCLILSLDIRKKKLQSETVLSEMREGNNFKKERQVDQAAYDQAEASLRSGKNLTEEEVETIVKFVCEGVKGKPKGDRKQRVDRTTKAIVEAISKASFKTMDERIVDILCQGTKEMKERKDILAKLSNAVQDGLLKRRLRLVAQADERAEGTNWWNSKKETFVGREVSLVQSEADNLKMTRKTLISSNPAEQKELYNKINKDFTETAATASRYDKECFELDALAEECKGSDDQQKKKIGETLKRISGETRVTARLIGSDAQSHKLKWIKKQVGQRNMGGIASRCIDYSNKDWYSIDLQDDYLTCRSIMSQIKASILGRHEIKATVEGIQGKGGISVLSEAERNQLELSFLKSLEMSKRIVDLRNHPSECMRYVYKTDQDSLKKQVLECYLAYLFVQNNAGKSNFNMQELYSNLVASVEVSKSFGMNRDQMRRNEERKKRQEEREKRSKKGGSGGEEEDPAAVEQRKKIKEAEVMFKRIERIETDQDWEKVRREELVKEWLLDVADDKRRINVEDYILKKRNCGVKDMLQSMIEGRKEYGFRAELQGGYDAGWLKAVQFLKLLDKHDKALNYGEGEDAAELKQQIYGMGTWVLVRKPLVNIFDKLSLINRKDKNLKSMLLEKIIAAKSGSQLPELWKLAIQFARSKKAWEDKTYSWVISDVVKALPSKFEDSVNPRKIMKLSVDSLKLLVEEFGRSQVGDMMLLERLAKQNALNLIAHSGAVPEAKKTEMLGSVLGIQIEPARASEVLILSLVEGMLPSKVKYICKIKQLQAAKMSDGMSSYTKFFHCISKFDAQEEVKEIAASKDVLKIAVVLIDCFTKRSFERLNLVVPLLSKDNIASVLTTPLAKIYPNRNNANGWVGDHLSLFWNGFFVLLAYLSKSSNKPKEGITVASLTNPQLLSKLPLVCCVFIDQSKTRNGLEAVCKLADLILSNLSLVSDLITSSKSSLEEPKPESKPKPKPAQGKAKKSSQEEKVDTGEFNYDAIDERRQELVELAKRKTIKVAPGKGKQTKPHQEKQDLMENIKQGNEKAAASLNDLIASCGSVPQILASHASYPALFSSATAACASQSIESFNRQAYLFYIAVVGASDEKLTQQAEAAMEKISKDDINDEEGFVVTNPFTQICKKFMLNPASVEKLPAFKRIDAALKKKAVLPKPADYEPEKITDENLKGLDLVSASMEMIRTQYFDLKPTTEFSITVVPKKAKPTVVFSAKLLSTVLKDKKDLSLFNKLNVTLEKVVTRIVRGDITRMGVKEIAKRVKKQLEEATRIEVVQKGEEAGAAKAAGATTVVVGMDVDVSERYSIASKSDDGKIILYNDNQEASNSYYQLLNLKTKLEKSTEAVLRTYGKENILPVIEEGKDPFEEGLLLKKIKKSKDRLIFNSTFGEGSLNASASKIKAKEIKYLFIIQKLLEDYESNPDANINLFEKNSSTLGKNISELNNMIYS